VGQIALDALLDSLKVLGVSFLVYFLLSFFEDKLARLLEKKKGYGPLLGSLSGSIPQCGISVVASDLYVKGSISMGTLVAVYLSTSDEALPIIFSSFGGKWYMAFVLLAIKMVGGALFGTLVDLIYRPTFTERGSIPVSVCHKGCCGHEVEGEGAFHEHFLHPLFHSLKIFLYAFIVNFLFNWLISYLGGEEALASFLSSNLYLSPLYALLVGLIPNCASSVVLSEVYLLGGIPFGALLTGLAVNAGLGPIYLFKSKKSWKEGVTVMLIVIASALIMGYAFLWIA